MKKESVFVKVSGDLFNSPEFLHELRRLQGGAFTVVCVGGGTQINNAFKKAKIKIRPHGTLGRVFRTTEERKLAKRVLNSNARILRKRLKKEKIEAKVITPVLDLGPVICHVNGDQLVRTMYLGFDRLYVVTTQKRREDKAMQFADLHKVYVLGI